ncbi:MAG TPA: T9SS type A sorting domain-containing protein [Paludibacteraceae bacterium]|nr:T9SS type A sorting domain-containing protein [Paludibacteraceae bacterium]
MKNLSVLLFLILAIKVSGQNIYQYDALNRLTLATYSNGAQYQYTYDELGNRMGKSTGCAVDITEGDTIICAGDSIQLHAGSNAGIPYLFDLATSVQSGYGAWSFDQALETYSVYNWSYMMPGMLVFGDSLVNYGWIEAEIIMGTATNTNQAGLAMGITRNNFGDGNIYNGSGGYYLAMIDNSLILLSGTANYDQGVWPSPALAIVPVPGLLLTNWNKLKLEIAPGGIIKGYVNDQLFLTYPIPGSYPIRGKFALVAENSSFSFKNINNFGKNASFYWSTGDTISTITVSPLVNTTYTVSLSESGCTDSVHVFVNPRPAAAGNISGPSTLCRGSNNVTYSVPEIGNATSYIWTLPAGVTGSSTTNTILCHFGEGAASGNITVRGHSACGDGASSQLSVTVNQLPGNNLSWPVNYDAHAVFTTGLNVPNQMVLNASGDIYVTNHSYASYSGPYYNTLAKIDGSGNKSVFVSGYSIPTGLSIDQQQNLYFTRNNYSSSIYKVLPAGSVSTFATLPHLPGPISLYQNGTDLNFYTVSHWGSRGIYRTNSAGTPSLFRAGSYEGCELSPDGLYLYSWTADTLYRFSTTTGIRENLVTNLTTYQRYPSCIGPDNKLYVAARSISDATKSSIYRINGANDFTVVIDNIPGNYEENDILFKPAGVNDYDLYLCEVAGSRTSPDLNRIIRFPDIFSGAASLISGPDSVYQGQNNSSFSVEPIPYATNYIWTYSGTGASITGNSNNVFVSFSENATSGILTVRGHNDCGDGPSSVDFHVTVTTGLLTNQFLHNVTIPAGMDNCYDATQTIIVAGDGTTFNVQNGGSVTLIAGQNIRFLPGARANSGGYLHGYITTNNEYCNMVRQPVAMVQTEQTQEKQGEPEFSGEEEDDWNVKVYPNPTSGIIHLVVQTIERSTPIRIRIYNLLGEVVYSNDLTGKNTDEITFVNIKPGMYQLQVIQGNNIEVVKVIRN